MSSQIKGCHAAIFSRWKWFFKEGNERHLLLWNLRKLINRPLWRSLQRANNCGVETGQLPWVLTHAFQWHSCPSFTQTLVSSSSSHMLLYTTPVNSSFLQGRRGCNHFSYGFPSYLWVNRLLFTPSQEKSYNQFVLFFFTE